MSFSKDWIIFYILWSIPSAIWTYFICKKEKVLIGHYIPVWACFIWGWIIPIDWHMTMKERAEDLRRAEKMPPLFTDAMLRDILDNLKKDEDSLPRFVKCPICGIEYDRVEYIHLRCVSYPYNRPV